MKYLMLLILFITGCHSNDFIKRAKHGEIITNIAYLNLIEGIQYWAPTKSNQNGSIKVFRLSKKILVRGLFRYADFSQVLSKDMQITAVELCGNLNNIKQMDIEYEASENIPIYIGYDKMPPPPKYDFFFRASTTLTCQ